MVYSKDSLLFFRNLILLHFTTKVTHPFINVSKTNHNLYLKLQYKRREGNYIKRKKYYLPRFFDLFTLANSFFLFAIQIKSLG